MDFKAEKYFIDAVNSGDIQEIKIAMCLYIDKDAGDFTNDIKNAIQFLDDRGIEIWEKHKEIEPLKPKQQWNIDYIGLLQSDLMYNFSRERLNNIIEVGKYVYGKTQTVQSNTSTNKNSKLINKDVTNKSNIDIDNKESIELQKYSSSKHNPTPNQYQKMAPNNKDIDNQTYKNTNQEWNNEHEQIKKDRKYEYDKNKSNAKPVVQKKDDRGLEKILENGKELLLNFTKKGKNKSSNKKTKKK